MRPCLRVRTSAAAAAIHFKASVLSGMSPLSAIRRLRRRTPPGSSPGTLIPDPEAPRPVVRGFSYDADQIFEEPIEDLATLPDLMGRSRVTWIDVCGLGDILILQRLGEYFGMHRLALEDVVNVYQRPKVEEYDDHLFVVMRMPVDAAGFDSEQLSLFLGNDYVLTFQERIGDCFEPVRERLRRKRGRIREAGADYLAYALVDAVTDAYFPVLERHGETVEALEEAVVEHPEPSLVGQIQDVKHSLLAIRRAVWPQREMLNNLIREHTPFVTERTRVYLRDCYDHAVQLMDMVETYREIASGLIDIYLSGMSARLNEVMKVLTIIATVFMPLSFITGLYGMNFDRQTSPWNMPELGWHWGYFYALGVMLAIALGFVWYFRRRGWIGDGPRARRRHRRG